MSRERIILTQAIPAVQQLRRVQGFDPLPVSYTHLTLPTIA